MNKYPEIIIDKKQNAPINMNRPISTENYYDFMHHTHKLSDLINDGGSANEIVSYDDTELREAIEELRTTIEETKYDDTELREDVDEAIEDLYNKIMGITDEDGTTVDEAFDTLKEVAKYIVEDGKVATEMLTKIAAIEEALNSKVDAVDGKSLVDNTEIERLAGLSNYDDTELREAIEAAKYDDTELREEIEAKVSYDKETVKADLVTDNYVDRRSEPYFDSTLNYFFANGVPITIEADPDDANAAIAKWGFKKSCKIPNSKTVKVLGGGDGFITAKTFAHTKITVNGGSIKAVYGGGLLNSVVDVAEIIVNGGYVIEALGGGMGWCDKRAVSASSVVYNANITINGGSAYIIIYGGGYGDTSIVDHTNITINDGSTNYFTAGGSNGATGSATVHVNGGNINVCQSTNRGCVGDVEFNMTGGTITNAYCGGETASDVSGTIESFKCNITGGTITNFVVGTDGSTAKGTGVEYVERLMNIDKISGSIAEGVVTNISDELKAKLQ